MTKFHSLQRSVVFLLLSSFAWLGIAGGPRAAAEEPAIPQRTAWTASRMVGTPDPPPPYRVELAFPRLKFEHPLDIGHPPSGNRLFVVEQAGKIYSFVNDQETAQLDLAVDLTQIHPEVTAAYALTFHPEFARNRLVYVCYVTGAGPDGSHISQFQLTAEDPPRLIPESEVVLLRWFAGGHNGCCLKFGPDGYLYISTGDGGDPSPPDPLQAGQDVSNLLSSILRIDVDRPDAGLAYGVPADNPLRDVPNARPEIWAYGFRNPWRMSFDRATGDLWAGDVGWQLWEMIYRVERGGNYGWPIVEGPQSILPEAARGPTPILPPAISHPHSEASSITGGYVYRGTRLPELEGVYIYGDFQSGKVWGLRHDGRQVTWQQELAQTPLQLVAFGEDPAGELYLLDYERSQQIFRLAKNTDDGRHGEFPRLLSQTGLFASTAEQTPSPGVLEYDINAAHWADYTTSRRWLALPGEGPLSIDESGNGQFPEGAVLAKTVGIEMERGAPATFRRLETQVLHREQGAFRPYTYVWNEAQTDAELASAAGADLPLKIVDPLAPEGIREQTYRIASRAECQLCHNPWVETKTTIYGVQTASPLAVTLAQLNRPCGDAGVGRIDEIGGGISKGPLAENQLAALAGQGWIAGNLPADSSEAPHYADPYDSTADLSERVRSYLQVNCAHCHQEHAGGAATIALTYETPLADRKLLDVRPAQGAFGISDARLVAPGDPLGSLLHYRMAKTGGGRMPRLGSNEVDEQAVALVREWIGQLPPSDAESAPPAIRQEDRADIAFLLSGSAPAESETRAAAIGRLTATTRGALLLLSLLENNELSAETRQQAIALSSEHPQSEVRDLFERFVPASQRLARLGGTVDAAELLALPADAERGRQLFFRDGAASCKSCHRIAGQGETLGPDLSQVGKKYRPDEMLAHLLEPSKFMEPKYVPYVLETVDGRLLTGLLLEQTDDGVVLRNALNQEVRVAADEVEILLSQQKSLMPDLLLRDLTPQQAADLLAYLCGLK